MRVLIAAMLIAVALAGCTDDPGGTRVGAPVAMLSTWDAAHDAAATHGKGILIHVTGLEYSAAGTQQVDLADPDVAVMAIEDPERGDGLSVLWRYRFTFNDTLETRSIFVGENGVVRDSLLVDRSGDDFSPRDAVSRPAMDSDAIMAAFKAEAPQYEITANKTLAVQTVGTPCGPLAIVLGFEDMDGDPDMAMFIDPDTGEIQGMGFVILCAGPMGEAAEIPFSITALQGDSGSFTLEADHEQISFTTGFNGVNPPGQVARAVVTGPNGTVTVPLDSSVVSMADAAAGDYTVTFTMERGVQMQGTFYACTGGLIYRPGNEPNVAC